MFQDGTRNAFGHNNLIGVASKNDGRKFDWIRQQLGLSKVELAKELGVSRQSVYRYIWAGPPRLVGLAMLGLWYQDRMGGLLEEPPEAAKKPARKPRRKAR